MPHGEFLSLGSFSAGPGLGLEALNFCLFFRAFASPHPCTALPLQPGRQSEFVCRGRWPGRGFGKRWYHERCLLALPSGGAGMSGSRFVHLGSRIVPSGSSSNLGHFRRCRKQSLDSLGRDGSLGTHPCTRVCSCPPWNPSKTTARGFEKWQTPKDRED